jgi:hypothetical protein
MNLLNFIEKDFNTIAHDFAEKKLPVLMLDRTGIIDVTQSVFGIKDITEYYNDKMELLVRDKANELLIGVMMTPLLADNLKLSKYFNTPTLCLGRVLRVMYDVTPRTAILISHQLYEMEDLPSVFSDMRQYISIGMKPEIIDTCLTVNEAVRHTNAKLTYVIVDETEGKQFNEGPPYMRPMGVEESENDSITRNIISDEDDKEHN